MKAITLKGITWKNPRGYDPLVAASTEWMKTNATVKVEWSQLPWYEFEDTVLKSLEDGKGLYDMIMFDHPWTGKMASEQWLIPMDSIFDNKYLDELRSRVVRPSMESYELYGHQWALPLDSACHTGLYRNDLADGNTLPQTWEEIQSWAEAHHNPPHRYALIINLEGVLGTCLFLSMMAGLGHAPYLDENRPSCNREAAAYTLTILKKLMSYAPPGSSLLGPWDIYEQFCSADNIIYSPSIFAYVNYFGKGRRRENLRLCQVPGFAGGKPGRPILGGVGMGIANTCSFVEHAKSLGAFLMSDFVQRDIFPAYCGQPSTRSAWIDKGINHTFNNFYTDLTANMETAYTRPRYPCFHRMELAIGKALQHWWNGNASLSETVNAISNPR